jgi:hypothetical protein
MGKRLLMASQQLGSVIQLPSPITHVHRLQVVCLKNSVTTGKVERSFMIEKEAFEVW